MIQVKKNSISVAETFGVSHERSEILQSKMSDIATGYFSMFLDDRDFALTNIDLLNQYLEFAETLPEQLFCTYFAGQHAALIRSSLKKVAAEGKIFK